MSDFTLTQHTFLTSATASNAGAWYELDYRRSGLQYRSIFVQRETSASDEVVLELRISDGDSVVEVIATATSWSGAGNYNSAVIQAPATGVRVRKVGSSAAATVTGLV